MGKQIQVEATRPTTQTTRSARGTKANSCCCGQQLDICGRPHCPRCGRNLSHP